MSFVDSIKRVVGSVLANLEELRLSRLSSRHRGDLLITNEAGASLKLSGDEVHSTGTMCLDDNAVYHDTAKTVYTAASGSSYVIHIPAEGSVIIEVGT